MTPSAASSFSILIREWSRPYRAETAACGREPERASIVAERGVGQPPNRLSAAQFHLGNLIAAGIESVIIVNPQLIVDGILRKSCIASYRTRE